MTRKDFELIAKAIRRSLLEQLVPDEDSENEEYWEVSDHNVGVEDAAVSIAQALLADNFRFDKDRFLMACGLLEKRS